MPVDVSQFSRITPRVDVQLMSDRRVVVIGVGFVGSKIARELALCGLGHLVLIDGDNLERHNVIRHELPGDYEGWNKAEGMKAFLERTVPTLDARALSIYIDDTITDEDVDEHLAGADLIVPGTDNRDAQRRVARRALALDIPAVIPGLYEEGGGELFVQLDSQHPCFMCWDGFRPPGTEVRGAAGLNAEALSLVEQAVFLCLGLLHPGSAHGRILAGSPQDRRLRQLLIQRPFAAPLPVPVVSRPNCPSCNGGPATTAARSAPSLPAPVVVTTTDAWEVIMNHSWPIAGATIALAVAASISLALIWIIAASVTAAAWFVNEA